MKIKTAFYEGLFFGGILALMINELLLIFAEEYIGLTPIIWIIILDFIMAIDLLIGRLGRVGK